MPSFPPQAGATQPPATRRRFVAFFLTLGVALALLVSPQPSTAAAAKVVRNSATAKQFANNMLTALNAERRAHRVRSVTMNSRLVLSAHRHNLTMAKRNLMSHQLPGEVFFGDRISSAGYNWKRVGENIGYNSAQTNAALQSLEKQMYAEKPPNDGHRQNILDSAFRNVGIDVYFDQTHNRMWFTQDFGQPAS